MDLLKTIEDVASGKMTAMDGVVALGLEEELERFKWKDKDLASSIDALRSELGVTGQPMFQKIVKFTEGTSNKFHVFALFKKGGEYVAGNAWGRIGYTPKAMEISRGKDHDSVMSDLMAKLRAKTNKGYK